MLSEHLPLLLMIAAAALAAALIGLLIVRLVSSRDAPATTRQAHSRDDESDALHDRVLQLEWTMRQHEDRLRRLENAPRVIYPAERPRSSFMPNDDALAPDADAPLLLRERARDSLAVRSAPYAEPSDVSQDGQPAREARGGPEEDSISRLASTPETLEAISDFNRLAAAGDRRGLQAFAQAHKVILLGFGQHPDELVPDEDGCLWWVNIGSPYYGLVVPAATVVHRWEMFYRALGGVSAKNEFGAMFDLTDGPVLKVQTPAWARRINEQNFRRVMRGLLQGI